MNCYHLIAAGCCWALTRDSDSKTLREFTTRWQAIDECRAILEGEPCSLVIHGKDGSVEAVRTYAGGDMPAWAETGTLPDEAVRELSAIRSHAPRRISRRLEGGGGEEGPADGNISATRAARRPSSGSVKDRSVMGAAVRKARAQRIGACILSQRTGRGLSRGELASVLGVSAWSIKEWEKGRSCPDKFRRQVSEWLGGEGDSLFEAMDEVPQNTTGEQQVAKA
jgi:hypothetical protein